MSKTIAATTIPPTRLAIDEDILLEDLRTVQRALHWSFVQRVETHLCLTTDTDNWDDWTTDCGPTRNALAVGTLYLNPTGSQQVATITDVWIDKDAAQTNGQILCSVECLCQVSNEVTVTFEWTGGIATVSNAIVCTSAHNNTERTATRTVNTFSNGNEWVTLRVLMQRTAGSSSGNYVRRLTVQEVIRDASRYPDPLNT